MIETNCRFQCDDGAKLFLRRWQAQEGTGLKASPHAILYITHGMAEHSLRYRRLAQTLSANGIEVWAADMRGHGNTADSALNSVQQGGSLGHAGDTKSGARIIEDLRLITRHIYEAAYAQYGKHCPFFVMGHSWGSFLTQGYIQNPSIPLAGCILSGTRGPGGCIVHIGFAVLTLIAAFKGGRRYSKCAEQLSTGSYNNPFKPNRTSHDWLSQDADEVDAYIADPLSGQRCSSAFYRDLTRLLIHIHRAKEIKRISKTLPIYIFCGTADPVGDMGASPQALVRTYRRYGINNVELVLYPEGRHEMLNETNRDEVTKGLLNWLAHHLD